MPVQTVQFKNYSHWCDFWDGAIPYPTPMEPHHLENIQQELPDLIFNNILWFAHRVDDKVVASRITSFDTIDRNLSSFSTLDLAANAIIDIQWEDIVDYKVENN